MELNDTFRFTKEPKHLNISGAISWGAWTEGYDLASRIIAMELHSAIVNDDGTKRCKKKCALLATALPVQHYGIKCTQIVFPAEIAQITLNVIISSPYEDACKKYEIQHDIDETFGDVKEQEKVDACNKENAIEALLASIAHELINGSGAKRLHFIPLLKDPRNFEEHIHIYFQIPSLEFSKRITQNWKPVEKAGAKAPNAGGLFGAITGSRVERRRCAAELSVELLMLELTARQMR
uniref:Uncharacterized protein n=1 Tax=Globodera rostochiensis TaxID=31243 RepID=A0A914H769_GLORO